jgi:hypothetical protein
MIGFILYIIICRSFSKEGMLSDKLFWRMHHNPTHNIFKPVTSKYFKFNFIKNRGGNYTQLSKIKFYNNNDLIPFTGAVAKSDTSSPRNETPPNAINNNIRQKWLSYNSKCSLYITFQDTITMNEYSITTANDYPTRDPITWNLYSSDDNNNWILIDSKNNYQTPTERFKEVKMFITAEKKILPPVPINVINEYKADENTLSNILNNLELTINSFNNDFKRLDELSSYDTEDEFNEFLRDKIQPQLKIINSLYDNVNNNLIKRSSDTRTQNDGNGGRTPFYDKKVWDDQQRKSQEIKTKINTFNSQITGFIQRIKQQKQEESVRTFHVKPIPPLPPSDDIYIPPSSSYISNYKNNKYINQYV